MKAEELFDAATQAYIDGKDEEAVRLYVEAADLDFLDAVKVLAEAYENGDKLSIDKDDRKALSYYKQAFLLDDSESFNKIINYSNKIERDSVIKDLLINNLSVFSSDKYGEQLGKYIEENEDFYSDTPIMAKVICALPVLAKFFNFNNFSSGQLKDIFISNPDLAKTFTDWEKISLNHIEELSEKVPSVLMGYPDASLFTTKIWVNLIIYNKELLKKCNLEIINSFNSKDWFEIIKCHPELAPDCVWKNLEKEEIKELILIKPEIFIFCNDWSKLDTSLRQLIKSRNPKITDSFISKYDRIFELKKFENIPLQDFGIIEMVLCMPGVFYMGSSPDEKGHCVDEIMHKVTISKPFFIGKYPVTQSLYQSIMGENPSMDIDDNKPVEKVPYKSATDFCRKLTLKLAGIIPADYMFNLPTEAQWEYACKAGCQKFDTGNDSSLPDYDTVIQTHSVVEGKPNKWQIYDMLGNVSEWCRSCYYKYPSIDEKDPTGPMIGQYRVCRGGSFKIPRDILRPSKRYAVNPSLSASPEIGFRIILESKR